MIKFPKNVNIKIKDKNVRFSINEIRKNVYTIEYRLQELKNSDNLIFGYLITKDDYLYAYSVIPKDISNGESNLDKYDYHLIYTSYIGSNAGSEMDEDTALSLCKLIGTTFAIFNENRNKHPAIINQEKFNQIYTELCSELHTHPDSYKTPYIIPVYRLATDLRDYYTNMAKRLDDIQKGQ